MFDIVLIWLGYQYPVESKYTFIEWNLIKAKKSIVFQFNFYKFIEALRQNKGFNFDKH
tara:strand:+ start:4570 stop:4743 length:174 start_codon:yes stop_codon:yes gene_type:complete